MTNKKESTKKKTTKTETSKTVVDQDDQEQEQDQEQDQDQIDDQDLNEDSKNRIATNFLPTFKSKMELWTSLRKNAAPFLLLEVQN